MNESTQGGGAPFLAEADCYRLLAACFYAPEKEAFIEEDLCGSLASLFDRLCPEAASPARSMGEALEAAGEEDLRVDHANLFLGPFELQAPPYGSVYLEKTRTLMGDSTMGVLAAYRENGLDLAEKDAPDHIAIELEFMSYLLGLAARSGGEGDRGNRREYGAEAHRFLGAFLAPWVPQLCERIRQGAETAFYRGLAECLDRFIESAMRRRPARGTA